MAPALDLLPPPPLLFLPLPPPIDGGGGGGEEEAVLDEIQGHGDGRGDERPPRLSSPASVLRLSFSRSPPFIQLSFFFSLLSLSPLSLSLFCSLFFAFSAWLCHSRNCPASEMNDKDVR